MVSSGVGRAIGGCRCSQYIAYMSKIVKQTKTLGNSVIEVELYRQR